MVGNPDGLAPHTVGCQPPRARGGRPLQDTKGHYPTRRALRGLPAGVAGKPLPLILKLPEAKVTPPGWPESR